MINKLLRHDDVTTILISPSTEFKTRTWSKLGLLNIIDTLKKTLALTLHILRSNIIALYLEQQDFSVTDLHLHKGLKRGTFSD